MLSFHQPRYEMLIELLAVALFVVGLGRMITMASTRRDGVALACVFLGSMSLIALAYSIEINIIRRYLLPVATLACIPFGALVVTPMRSLASRLAPLGITIALFLACYTAYSLDVVARVPVETQTVSWRSDLPALSAVIAEQRQPGEPLVLTAWDLSPLQYYLGESLPFAPPSNDAPSLLLVTSPFTPADPLLDSASVLYEDPVEGLKILRLIRGRASGRTCSTAPAFPHLARRTRCIAQLPSFIARHQATQVVSEAFATAHTL
ncbi:hypothetical protein HC891_06535 [Candidatus Gracilibacteria bacterium]|nr:hypothetical protein [Candidatus Gracilibacteria bacterium]